MQSLFVTFIKQRKQSDIVEKEETRTQL